MSIKNEIPSAPSSELIRILTLMFKTFETNFMGTINVLEASVKLKKVKTILVVTTDKVYENINKAKRSFITM